MTDSGKKHQITYYFPQLDINDAFILACKNNDLETVKKILTNHDSQYKPEIDYRNSSGHSGPTNACQFNDFKILNYLLTSPELMEHADIHAHEDLIFIMAIVHYNYALLHFLIIDMKIKRTKHIDKFTAMYADGYAERLFKIRELKKDLNCEMHINKLKKQLTENEVVKV